MNAIVRPAFVTASRLAASAKRYVLLAFDSFVDARVRRARHGLEFRRSFDAYREGKGIPPLNDDLRAGS
jgi:hypothetical protein